MKYTISLTFICIAFMAQGQVKVDDFRRPTDGKDWSKAINRAMRHLDSLGHGTLEFTGTRTYFVADEIELPRYSKHGKRIFIINGNGCIIKAPDSVCVFNRIPISQKEALGKMMGLKFVIQDFVFRHGRKAINIGATYGTNIRNCEFILQREAAVDIQFGLMTIIENCVATNCRKDAFVLRHGSDWGGSPNNSQSNHSVIKSCRVYALKGSRSCYRVIASGGCVLRDIIAEGSHEVDYSVYMDRKGSSTIRTFRIENFHLEHVPKKAGIFVNMTGNTTIDGLFYQQARPEFPLILAGSSTDHINLMNIPHFVAGTVIKQTRGGAGTGWSVMYCNRQFYLAKNWLVRAAGDAISFENKLPRHFTGQGRSSQVKSYYGQPGK